MDKFEGAMDKAKDLIREVTGAPDGEQQPAADGERQGQAAKGSSASGEAGGAEGTQTRVRRTPAHEGNGGSNGNGDGQAQTGE